MSPKGALSAFIILLCCTGCFSAHVSDDDLTQVLNMARSLLTSGFNAGANYPEVWARDSNTFLDVIMDVLPQENISAALLRFLEFQHPNGELSDGYVLYPNSTAMLFKNNDETDQETSLIQALSKYIVRYNDFAVVDRLIANRSVYHRVNDAFSFLFNERFSAQYGLIWGGTTIDWGDCQPEGVNQTTIVNLTSLSHLAIDIYDNSMLVMALRAWGSILSQTKKHSSHAEKYFALANQTVENINTHLWDSVRSQWRPHIYLNGSPFQNLTDFVEDDIFYFGGTGVSAQAGLLNQSQVLSALQRMSSMAASVGPNVTIGLTTYPIYPADAVHSAVIAPWYYQNGGDWPWFGGRWIQALITMGLVEEAEEYFAPMVRAVLRYNGFFEWFDKTGSPAGSPNYHGAAGVLGEAVKMLQSARAEIARRSPRTPPLDHMQV